MELQRRFLPLVVALVPALALASCGGESDTDDNEGSAGSGGNAGTLTSSPDAGGASRGGQGGSAGAEPEPDPRVDDAWLTCATDADCVIVQERGCAACVTLSVNVTHEQDVRDVYQSLNCTRSSPCPPRPTPTCNAGVCDYVVDCALMESVGLCSELARCVVLVATPCVGGDPARVGCFPRNDGAAPGRTCAVNPDTAEQLVFSSSYVPEGWATCDTTLCAP